MSQPMRVEVPRDPGAEAAPGRSRRRWGKRLLRLAAALVLLLVVAAAAAGVWAWRRLDSGLPRLEGEIAVEGLSAPVRVERDALGVPVVRGSSRADVAFGTGFLHAQDRYFQMDLLRRRAAGELSELVGSAAVELDSRLRVHRFRDRARRVVEALPRGQRALLRAYARGVEAGRADLGSSPFEYTLLGVDPTPWEEEDSILVVYSMFIELQEEFGEDEAALGLMRELLPEPVFRFLTPQGTEWDAPLLGGPLPEPPLPAPGDVGELQTPARRVAARTAEASGEGTLLASFGLVTDSERASEWVPGSNAWAVAGSRTADGRALLANDMHLGLAVPNIWYRASFAWGDASSGGLRRATGVTLPGTPLLVVGSNGRVAWGFSNSQTDASDVVLLETLPDDPGRYRVPGGSEAFQKRHERIRVKGGEAREVEVLETRWGPVIGQDALGRLQALRWVAHEPGGMDLGLAALESVETVDEALLAASRSGIPAQNLVVADREGRIGWTVAGYLPRRLGFDGGLDGGFGGRLPGDWSDGSRSWDGRLAPGEYPRVTDPEAGAVWTANQRVVGGELLERVGDGGYTLGARARQIRDRLASLEAPDEAAMLGIQLDNEARFLARWQELFLEVAETAASDGGDRPYGEARRLVADWGRHAAVDSVGYRLVREFRVAMARLAFEAITAPVTEVDPDFVYYRTLDQYEGPLWRLVTERPPQLLDPRYASWDALLRAGLDETLDGIRDEGTELGAWTWGARNTIAIRHPLSRALPGVGRFLDMPRDQLPGDSRVPRVQHPSGGASERMVVSPGHEEDGIFHMPGGQSAHPLSSHYRDGHSAWARGEATPFLPGEPVHVLVLVPAGRDRTTGSR